MRVFTVAAFLFLGATAVAGELYENYSVSGKANGQSYQFTATKAEFAKTPVWPVGTEHPPLAPRRAEEIARRQLQQLVPSGADWRLEGITVFPLGDDLHWVYSVEFSPPLRPDVAVFMGDYMRLLVLFDGSVIKPKITPIPPIPH
jgi:hypothetical protein